MKALVVMMLTCLVILLSVSYPPVQGNAGGIEQIQNTEMIIEQNKTVTDMKLQQLEMNLVILDSLERN